MLVERKKLTYVIFRMILESYDDKTKAIIPHHFSKEKKERLMRKYDEEGRDWDVKSAPAKDDPFSMTPEERIRYVLQVADRLSADIQKRSEERKKREEARREAENLAYIEKIKQKYAGRQGFEDTGVLAGSSVYTPGREDDEVLDYELPASDDTTLPLGRM